MWNPCLFTDLDCHYYLSDGRLYLYWRHKNVKPVCDFLFIAQWSSLSEAWRRSEGNLSQWVNLSVTSRVLFVVYSVQCSLWSHVLPVLYSVYSDNSTGVQRSVHTTGCCIPQNQLSPEISPRLPPQSGCSCDRAPILSDNRPECCDIVTPEVTTVMSDTLTHLPRGCGQLMSSREAVFIHYKCINVWSSVLKLNSSLIKIRNQQDSYSLPF